MFLVHDHLIIIDLRIIEIFARLNADNNWTIYLNKIIVSSSDTVSVCVSGDPSDVSIWHCAGLPGIVSPWPKNHYIGLSTSTSAKSAYDQTIIMLGKNYHKVQPASAAFQLQSPIEWSLPWPESIHHVIPDQLLSPASCYSILFLFFLDPVSRL